MPFLIDPPWLYATGVADRPADARANAGGTRRAHRDSGAFLATSISLLSRSSVDAPDLASVPRRERTDWMLTRGLQIDHRRAGPRAHEVSASLFATYPWWLLLGEKVGRRRR